MRPIKYQDKSINREVEDDDDWEATGKEEMNELYARCTQKKSITDVRDELSNLRDLLDVCSTALLSREAKFQCDFPKNVAHVLHFYVDPVLQNLDKELARQ